MDLNNILEHINFSNIKQEVKSAFYSLINLVEKLSSENRQLKKEVQRLRDENNRLKGEQGKPEIKANTKNKKDISSEKERKKVNVPTEKRKKHAKTKDIKIDRQRTCYVDKSELPQDAVFKGYCTVTVQDIKITTDNIQFKKEIYYSPSQHKTYTAKLPQGYEGEFGPTIKALTIIFKHVCNMSEAKIFEFFKHFGIYISKGKISNILIKEHQQFHQEKTDIVEAGLKTTVYQGIDDTKARVNGQNHHTHILGNPYYTAYFTKPKKNRLTVLKILKNEKELTYCLSHHALIILEQLTLSKKYFKKLHSLESEKIFNQEEFNKLISQHFPLLKDRAKSKIIEAAAITAYGKGVDHLVVKVLLCDNAPQFKLI